ncbi:MAG TPA: acetyl-CoA carboxylase carboxyltransferase subunit alpha [Chthonomonadaceae bacterium]|nr:acetyl-CoA carboxylase carboxyltransferase subunit alpha [Chthonomonadaceae bacterium]
MLSNPLDFEKPIAELDSLIAELKQVAKDPHVREDAKTKGIDIEIQIAELESRREQLIRQIFSDLTPWNQVQMARHPQRPYSLDYVRLIFEDFLELHGDRVNADDPAIIGGLARFQGEPVVVIGQQKGRDLKERQYRNFGSARPSGFRKALRLMKLAEKFNRPLIIFVDTPAAEANLTAEEEGISQAIAVNLREMIGLRVPIVVAIIGEGGSGGALGIAVGDRILMLEHAIYSVIPPESCAAILWNDRSRAPEAAEALKLTARHALEFGLIDQVLPEPLGGAHRDLPTTAATLKKAFARHLAALGKMTPEELLQARYTKFRCMGEWEDTALSRAAQTASEKTPRKPKS